MNLPLLKKVLGSPRLPSLPAVALRVIEQCRRNDTDLRHIAETITADPSLSTKVLKTVNSSYYGRPEPVATITQALAVLGLNSVKTLVLGFTLVEDFKGAGGERFDMSGIWRRSLYAAVGARAAAGRAGLAEDEEALLGGLLQDLGVIAMIATLGERYIRVLADAADHSDLSRREREALGMDHAQVGEAIAEHFALPPILRAPIRHHERPEGAPEGVRRLVEAVSLGGCAADLFVAGSGGDAACGVDASAVETGWAAEQFFAQAEGRLGLGRAEAAELLHEIGRDAAEMAGVFEISAEPARGPSEILATANELLQRLSLETQQSAWELEQQNRSLRVKAATDPLTGAANRGRFEDFLCRQFERASGGGGPVSLILIDTDNFKRVNDTRGHVAGDRVLVSLAQALREGAPEGALVARYGGEEFAVVAPDLGRREAAFLAEKLRRVIEGLAVEEGRGALRITASLGVATHDGGGFFTGPEQLVKAADRAAYAAKAAGRNAVRVFAPRPAPAVQAVPG